MNRVLPWFLILFCISSFALAQSQPPTNASSSAPIFRDAFTLTVRIDKKHYYKQDFAKIPYVIDNDIYLFAGENFGINVALADDEISGISYQSDISKADVWFSFDQDKNLMDGTAMMLIIQNKLKRKLFLDALMTTPQGKALQRTSILPVPPALSDYESWPHPIVQLVLRNVRLKQ